MTEVYINKHWVDIDLNNQFGNLSTPANKAKVQGETDAENPIEQTPGSQNEADESHISS